MCRRTNNWLLVCSSPVTSAQSLRAHPEKQTVHVVLWVLNAAMAVARYDRSGPPIVLVFRYLVQHCERKICL